MPYSLRKAPKRDLYWVVNKDTGEKYSKDPLPKERAEAQRRALYASENRQEVMTHKERFLKKHNLTKEHYSLKELASISKVPLKILQEVFNRGVGAARTQPDSVRLKGSYVKNVSAPKKYKLSDEQWAYARVYSFLDGNPKHDNDLRRNLKKVGGAVSVEQRLSELNALIPSEEKWNTMKAQNPSNPMLKNTYAEFRAYKEDINRQRAEALAPTAEKEATSAAQQEELKQINEAYEKFYTENPEARPIVCNLNEKLERVKQIGVPAAVCQARHAEYNRKKMSENPFGKIVQGLTDVADFAAENLTDFLPGIGQVAAEVYKSFAPPTSVFSSQNMLVGQGIPYMTVKRGGQKKKFEDQLKQLGISAEKYLQANRHIAKEKGYNPKNLKLSDKPEKKLMMIDPEGNKTYFGQVGYDDFLLLSLSGQKELAHKKRKAYLARATKMRGDWKKDKYSANCLATEINWAA